MFPLSETFQWNSENVIGGDIEGSDALVLTIEWESSTFTGWDSARAGQAMQGHGHDENSGK